MTRLLGAWCVTMLGCGGGGSGAEGPCPYLVPQDPAETCDPAPVYGGTVHHCNMCGGGAVCVAGASSGEVVAFGAVESANGAICTRTCTTVADCAGLSYLGANADVDGSRTTQQWACSSLGGAFYCTVALSAESSSTNACQDCLSACRGDEDCCTGCGCICQSSCGGSC